MNPLRFDARVQKLSAVATRRRTLAALVGMALLNTGLETAIAKPEPHDKGTTRGKSRRRGKRPGKRKERVRAQAKTKPGNHCVSPFGVDLNEVYGIDAQIVTPYCPQVNAGQHWITSGNWFVNETFAVVPEGFVPAGETPVKDFQAKFTALKLVIDPGTRQEQTVVFTNTEDLFTSNASAYLGSPTDIVLISPVTLGTVHSLSVGDHVVAISWVFSAMHCDGIGDDPTPAGNCFPAGETKYVAGLAFEVMPGHR